jgi:hypothetical protein
LSACAICNDIVLDGFVAEEAKKGTRTSLIASKASIRGFPLTATRVTSHLKHSPVEVPDPYSVSKEQTPVDKPIISKRDAAAIIKDRLLDALEARENSDEGLDILAKDLQPALKSALAAQSMEDKREQKKVTQNFWVQLYTGQQGELPLLDDGNTVEGVAVEVG